MPISKQTPDTSFFRYNPHDGVMLHLFRADHNPAKTRRLNLMEIDATDQYYRSVAQSEAATYMVLTDKQSKQTSVMLYGRDGTTRRIENYSIVFPGKKRKKVFGSY